MGAAAAALTFSLVLVAYLARADGVSNHVAFYVFGDSDFDTGNSNYINTTAFYQGDYFPYGMTYFHYPTGRTCDGRIIPDFIAQYAGLPLLRPYLEPGNDDYYNGTDFASVGGGCLLETASGLVIPLKTQLEYFENVVKKLGNKLGEEEANKLLANAVYLFSIGSNDYVSPILNNSTLLSRYTHEEFVDMVIGNLTDGIKEVYNRGGRKFAFVGLQDLGCLPVLRILREDGRCNEEATALSKLHNARFSERLSELRQQLDGFVYSNLEYYEATSERVWRPKKYGLEVGQSACCGVGRFRGNNTCGGKKQGEAYEQCHDPSKYVYFDSGRHTEAINRQYSEIFWNGAPPAVEPYNLKHLFQLQVTSNPADKIIKLPTSDM